MRKTPAFKRISTLSALCDGNSINATARMVGVSKVMILRLVAEAGTFCAQYHDDFICDLAAKRIQLDEIWASCGCKDG